MKLYKDGITVELTSPIDINRYKKMGFTCPPVVEPEPGIQSPENLMHQIIEGEVKKSSVKASQVKEEKNG